ncbi:MAG: arginase [Woeseiaceae bacterium]|nr:arginase [Woeseiaceae bacterium]
MSNPRENSKSIRIIAVPIDLGASRRGTDAGPSAMRIAGLHPALTRLGHAVDSEIDIKVPAMETQHSKDDAARFKDEILDVCTNLAETTRDALADGHVPLIIGGDHSLAMGSVAGVAAHYGARGEDIGMVWIDAHADMNTPGSSPSGNVHGMPLAHLLGYGDADMSSILDVNPAIKPENTVLIGVREIDRREREYVRKSGLTVFTMRDIDELGMTEVCRRAMDIATSGTAGFHVSFDVDGCDPSVMPGSGTLVPGGISYREAHQLLENCADTGRMTSMDVVELNPFLDEKNVSAERAVNLVQSAFGRSIL